MAGLIPLMLASGSRTSFISPRPQSQQQPPARSPTPAPSSAPPSPAARPRSFKRFSLSSPASIPVLPYTQAEWRKAISDIKRHHLNKRYRACSAKCIEILDGIKETSSVEPLYLIYLHFYAATSMEICAKPLPPTSTLRASLLQQARTHFDRASSLVNDAEASAVRKVRPDSASSSRSSSCHSPAGSVSSQAWTSDTRMSSPTNSVCSLDDLSVKSQSSSPVKRVKKVSFSLPEDETPFRAPEPIVRPDSPTLGFDDDYFQMSPIRQELPELPTPAKLVEVELPLHSIPESQEEEESVSSLPDEDAFIIARSVDRYCEHLESLKTQLMRHSNSLNELLNTKATPSPIALSDRSIGTNASKLEEMRALDRKARIERLRQNGWQRKRFDASRYEQLCEEVLQELE